MPNWSTTARRGRWRTTLRLSGPPTIPWISTHIIYPYDENVTNPLDITFNIQAEQTDADSFAASDLMLARTIGVARGATVCLMFYHALSLVDVTFTPLEEGADEVRVQLHDVCNSVKVNLAGEELKAEPDESSRGSVDMYLFPYGSGEVSEYRA